MKRLLIFPASQAQEEAFLEAKKMGLAIVTIDMDPQAYCFKHADESYAINPSDLESLTKFIQTYPNKLDGSLLVGADIPESQALICSLLGIDGIAVDAARLTVDKFRMKKVLRDAGLLVPDFYSVHSAKELENIVKRHNSKMVLKPNDNCGARGVIQVKPDTDFNAAFKHTISYVKKRGVILEKFEPGMQISIEGIVINNNLHTTGFADRNYNMIDKLSPYIIENGATMPTLLSKREKEVVMKSFESGVKALGLHTGVVKGDIVFNGSNAVIIEIAGRISGGKFASKLVPYSAGTNLLKAAIQQAIGDDIDFQLLQEQKQEGVAVRYFFPPTGLLQKIEGIDAVKSNSFCIELKITYNIGDIIPDITSHPQRGGWVVCHAPDRKTAVEQAEKMVEEIKFIIKAK
jgi:biotin carboxylase